MFAGGTTLVQSPRVIKVMSTVAGISTGPGLDWLHLGSLENAGRKGTGLKRKICGCECGSVWWTIQSLGWGSSEGMAEEAMPSLFLCHFRKA